MEFQLRQPIVALDGTEILLVRAAQLELIEQIAQQEGRKLVFIGDIFGHRGQRGFNGRSELAQFL